MQSDVGQSQDPREALRSLVQGLPVGTTSQIPTDTIVSVVQQKLEPEPEKPVSETVTDEPEKPPEKIAPKADKATVVNGGKFTYTGKEKQLGVVFGGKELYLEGNCLVTYSPDCGELTLDDAPVRWDAILLEESADGFLACAPGGKALAWKATPLSVMTLCTCIGTTSIAWGNPYYPRGWVTSLMATVSCKGTLTWRGQKLTVGQNRHRGGIYGSAWIEGLKNDGVNPQDFPTSWTTALQTTGLPDGTTTNIFALELKFVTFLAGPGGGSEKPLKAFDQTAVSRRLRKLVQKYGQTEVDLVYKAPQ